MSPESNYRNYRAIRRNLGRSSFIPFVGLCLKDLFFANEVPKTIAPDPAAAGEAEQQPRKLMNMEKIWRMHDIVVANFGK